MTQDLDEPPSMNASSNSTDDATAQTADTEKQGLLEKVKDFFSTKSDTTLRETIEEYIIEETENNGMASVSMHERELISNVLELSGVCALDVMIPRADIVCIEQNAGTEELFSLLSERQYSRIPVYKETLDHVIGTIHVKDILATLARGEKVVIKNLVRDVPTVSPSMPVLDLLLQMRISKKHMALVIDEYGGIDGLVTIGDLIEAIIGEVNDEYNPDEQPEIIANNDGTVTADARIELEEFEKIFGEVLTEEEREECDTLGGLVFFLAGRVPVKGEIIKHPSDMKFEILEADPRRVSRLSIHQIPEQQAAE